MTEQPSDYAKVTNLDRTAFLGPRVPVAGLKAGDGGGTFDDMEARVAVLENEVKHIREDIGLMRSDVHKSREDIGTIKTDIALAKSDIARLPSKEWNVKALIGLAAFITALTVLINFGPAIIRLLRAH